MKTKQERLEEVIKIRKELHVLGYRSSHDQVKKVFDKLSKYVENGYYYKGKFKIHGYKKVIHLILFPNRPISVFIKHLD